MSDGGAVPSAAAAPDLLAPGFRFHPTDVELVLYYLKRKVAGRPLRVEPIAELDIYKREPWDLPPLSRLRSGDMEWYFFSPLDRKYASRSRTNRATPQGYWKTTGKDRPVRHAGRTVGMKKTLVFHSGRAPRGLRTNWVMHEYRLEAADHVPHDGYVVCRIFQKSSVGPQNGAHYGAPFVEEEWEEEEEEGEDSAVAAQEGSHLLPDGGDQDYWQLTDFLENMDVGNQEENTALLTMRTSEQNGDSQREEPTLFLEDIINNPILFNDVDGYVNMPKGRDMMHIYGVEENPIVGQSDASPTQSDGFMELTDLGNFENVDGLSIADLVGCLPGTCTDPVYGTDESSILPQMYDGEEFFDFVNENFEQPELFQVSPELQNDMYLQPNNFLNTVSGGNIPDQSNEDKLDFFDAPSEELGQENCTQMNDLRYSPIVNSSGFDMVDELMAFFDATDAKLQSDPLNSLQILESDDSYSHSNPDQQVGFGSLWTSEAATKASGKGIGMDLSSSMKLPSNDNRSSGKIDAVCGAPDRFCFADVPRNEVCDKSLKKRLVNMLGSISSPPALAAEFPAKVVTQFAQDSATHSTSSIHLTAGLVHIKNLTLTNNGEHWSVHKSGSVGFLLTRGVAGNDAVGKSIAFEPARKMHGGALTVVLRGWFCVFFLSALFLAASFTIGVYIYSR